MKLTDVIKDPTWVRDIKVGAVDEDGVANYLLRSIPPIQIARLCASYIFQDLSGGEPIVITENEFKRHFRIQGWKEIEGFTGTRENRGSYSTKGIK